MPPEAKTIGEHVHKRRKDLGLHQWQLAKMLGVWRATLGSWEANHYEPERKVCARGSDLISAAKNDEHNS